MRIFNVTKIHSISPEEIPGKFTFEVPIGGTFYFTQDEEHLYLYLEGDTKAPLEKVEALMIQEGEEIPAGYTTEFIALLGYGVYGEDEDETNAVPIWAVVVVKDKQVTKGQQTVGQEWKKKF